MSLKNDPTPIKITCEEDFPACTALREGEGMLPREIPLRTRGQSTYLRGNRNDNQRDTARPSQDVRNNPSV